MSTEEYSIKYYGEGDIGNYYNLHEAVPILDNYDPEVPCDNVNQLLELYNIQMLLETGKLVEWDKAKEDKYCSLAKSITGTCARYFAQINDENISSILNDVSFCYTDDFWKLIAKFGSYKRITEGVFYNVLVKHSEQLHDILHFKELVTYFGNALAKFMRESDETVRILCLKFLESEVDTKYYIPTELAPSEFDGIFTNYACSAHPNPNFLQLILNSNSTKECPISDELRLLCKKNYQKFWDHEAKRHSGIEYGCSVQFCEQEEVRSFSKEEPLVFCHKYDVRWIKDNLDFPTLLNNFIYLFDFFDREGRSCLHIPNSQVSIIEKQFGVRGRQEYFAGSSFKLMNMLHALTMRAYREVLHDINIEIENVFKWFFETYIKEEFQILGFVFSAPTQAASLPEKCRSLASEMDGVLKQYRMYLKSGEIDRELLEMSSGHIIFSALGSLIPEKYAYCNSRDLQIEMKLLFSNQSILSHAGNKMENYNTFWDIMRNEKMLTSDFPGYSQEALQWLQGRGALTVDSQGYMLLNNARAFVLKDLYDHDVICLQYYDDLRKIADDLHGKGDIRYESSLFSEPEQDYLNYMLNRSQFSNGLDLRNKYSHSTYPLDEDQQALDYVQLLVVMVLVIVKINEDLCLHFGWQKDS